MRSFTLASAVAVLMATGSIALAEEATGTIEAVDGAGRTIMLDDGVTYQLAEAVDVEALKVGEKVTITYEQADGKITVSALVPAE